MPPSPLAATVVLALSLASLPGADGVQLVSSHPADGADNVAVSASLHLRFSAPLDPMTLGGLTLHEDPGPEVASKVATDLTNAAVTLVPAGFLRPGTGYELRGAAKVRSAAGRPLEPFRLRFTTGDESFEPGVRLVFEPETFDTTRSMTTVVVGPDRRLYAADAFGGLYRWDLDEGARPVNRTRLDQDPERSRQYIDLEWEPGAAAENLVLWASYAERLTPPESPRHYFTGTIARLELGADGVVGHRAVVTGLPHGRERQGGFDTLPHQPNGLVFHAGKLYQSVGSTSSSGGPPNWGVREQRLSACILEIDYDKITGTLDVFPPAGFDPGAPDSPLRVFATGVRNALELVAHSNGNLYTATNLNDRGGRGDGVPDAPDIPGDQNALVTDTTPDQESLLLIRRGRHYGFPNPARGQYVLNGGNPTAGADPFEIAGYPVGTPPDPGFAPELMFPIWRWGGTSPNGMIEYRPRFPHPLAGTLFVCFYSANDIAVLTLGSDGLPAAVEKLRAPDRQKLPFNGPLDINFDPHSGNLYVADFGRQSVFGEDGSIVMLRPAQHPAPNR